MSISVNPFYPEPSAPDLLLLLDWPGGSFIASSSHWLLTNVFYLGRMFTWKVVLLHKTAKSYWAIFVFAWQDQNDKI